MTRRSGIVIMSKLIGLLKGLIPIMLAAVMLGTIGYLCAISITIFGAQIISSQIDNSGPLASFSPDILIIAMIVAAILRGLLHYIEQYCNHFIAFKLLAIVRHNVFHQLRQLCPAKLDGKDKGNLISVITTDIELLEVFYAHTISPILIAILSSLAMIAFFCQYSLFAGIYAAVAYCLVGIAVPLINSKRGKDFGTEYREKFGELNSFTLDTLRGLEEVIQFDCGQNKLDELRERTENISSSQRKLSNLEGTQRSSTNAIVLFVALGMFLMTVYLNQTGQTTINGIIVCTVAMMGSFGPVIAIASLSNNLNQTLASGERVLQILEEEPSIEEVVNKEPLENLDCKVAAGLEQVDFSYYKNEILDNFAQEFNRGKLTGILGPSGCGKSTILKLLMRFYDPQKGKVRLYDRDVKEVNSSELRAIESYVTQDTHLFNDTIANNIAIGKLDATRDEIVEASKKASVHDFIETLSQGYDTKVGELGEALSGGEKQRIGIARAFLHNGDIMLLDEPTSNLDSLNEGIILKSLNESAKNKTIILVSHRRSTLSCCDELIELKS